ncbi:MAG: PAS domain-containing protein [Elusimicrobiales bacterium]|jgi:PAS domain S-box-containing protein|nr:PAS domain-containing protein [Elusimicrobiales bacterium]NLH38550.1 PAS domain-containing protein [Elusimicrobiota bacterium]
MDIHKLILENLKSGIISFDVDGNILYLNPMAEKILHLNREELINKNYKDVLNQYTEFEDLVYDMISENKTVRRGEMNITHAEFILRIGYSSMQIKDTNQSIVGYTLIFQDLSIISKHER